MCFLHVFMSDFYIFSWRIMCMISGTFWVWKKFHLSTPRGVFECHPGAKCVSFMFLGSNLFYIILLGSWEWYLAYFEFEFFFIWASPGGSSSVTQGRNVFPLCFLDRFFSDFSFRMFGVISCTFWVWNFFIWTSQGGLQVSPRDKMCFLYIFGIEYFYIFLLGSWEWYLAHFEF